MGQPWLLGQAVGLEGSYFVGMTQSQADLVKPPQQTVFAKRLHLKRPFLASGVQHDLAFQVDRELVAGKGGNFIKQLTDLGLAQANGQQGVFETVVEKDVGIARRNDGAKAILTECPRGVLCLLYTSD